ncbi:MAG: cupin domain-containing protein [Candidatus Binatia bacterium]
MSRGQREDILIQTEEVRVRVLKLESHEEAAWHYHSEITDNMFGLGGNIEIQLRAPEEKVLLGLGQRCEVRSGREHRVVNKGKQKARYLLVQGVGKYDYNVVNS